MKEKLLMIARLPQKKFFRVVPFVMHILSIKSHVVLVVVPEILHFSTLLNLQTQTAIISIFSLFLFHSAPSFVPAEQSWFHCNLREAF